jgi:hypothetical protein
MLFAAFAFGLGLVCTCAVGGLGPVWTIVAVRGLWLMRAGDFVDVRHAEGTQLTTTSWRRPWRAGLCRRRRRTGGSDLSQTPGVALGEAPGAVALVLTTELVACRRIVSAPCAVAHLCQFCRGEQL